jgi:hypothetical protein
MSTAARALAPLDDRPYSRALIPMVKSIIRQATVNAPAYPTLRAQKGATPHFNTRSTTSTGSLPGGVPGSSPHGAKSPCKAILAISQILVGGGDDLGGFAHQYDVATTSKLPHRGHSCVEQNKHVKKRQTVVPKVMVPQRHLSLALGQDAYCKIKLATRNSDRRESNLAATKRKNLRRLFAGEVVVFDADGEHQEVTYAAFDPEYPERKAKKTLDWRPGAYKTKDMQQLFRAWGRGWDRRRRREVPGVNKSELRWGLQKTGLHVLAADLLAVLDAVLAARTREGEPVVRVGRVTFDEFKAYLEEA